MIQKTLEKSETYIDKFYPYSKIYTTSVIAITSAITLWTNFKGGSIQLASIALIATTFVVATKEAKDISKKHIIVHFQKNIDEETKMFETDNEETVKQSRFDFFYDSEAEAGAAAKDGDTIAYDKNEGAFYLEPAVYSPKKVVKGPKMEQVAHDGYVELPQHKPVVKPVNTNTKDVTSAPSSIDSNKPLVKFLLYKMELPTWAVLLITIAAFFLGLGAN